MDWVLFLFVTMHAFDRQTDRRTDRIPIAIPRLHSMQRGKNWFNELRIPVQSSVTRGRWVWASNVMAWYPESLHVIKHLPQFIHISCNVSSAAAYIRQNWSLNSARDRDIKLKNRPNWQVLGQNYLAVHGSGANFCFCFWVLSLLIFSSLSFPTFPLPLESS